MDVMPMSPADVREDMFMMELAQEIERLSNKYNCELAFYVGDDGELEIHGESRETN